MASRTTLSATPTRASGQLRTVKKGDRCGGHRHPPPPRLAGQQAHRSCNEGGRDDQPDHPDDADPDRTHVQAPGEQRGLVRETFGVGELTRNHEPEDMRDAVKAIKRPSRTRHTIAIHLPFQEIVAAVAAARSMRDLMPFSIFRSMMKAPGAAIRIHTAVAGVMVHRWRHRLTRRVRPSPYG
jgi:hypothetical protein